METNEGWYKRKCKRCGDKYSTDQRYSEVCPNCHSYQKIIAVPRNITKKEKELLKVGILTD